MRPGHPPTWKKQTVEKVAADIFERLPVVVRKLIATTWPGGDFVALQSDNPEHEKGLTKTDVINNKVFVVPVIREFPKKNPSVYFLADTLVHLDTYYLDGKLLQPASPANPASVIALQNARKLHAVIGHLRYMFRGGRCNSTSPDIAEMKAMLERNPRAGRPKERRLKRKPAR